MKKLAVIICALCFGQIAFGALDRDYFDYTQNPEFQALPADSSPMNGNRTQYSANTSTQGTAASATPSDTVVITKKRVVTKKGKRRLRFGNEGSSWVNTYWNFGQPVYGETGRF